MIGTALEDRPKPGVQRFEVPIERDLTGEDIYHAKIRFASKGWELVWALVRNDVCVCRCHGVTDPAQIRPLLTGAR